MQSIESVEWKSHKSSIVEFIRSYLSTKKTELAEVSEDGEEACNRLIKFSTKGKSVRGCLVAHMSYLFTGSVSDDAIRTGAAIELLHSGFLVHDDVMDNDTLRRGDPSMHAQYISDAKRFGHKDPLHAANSLAICVGDICFFMAAELLGELSCSTEMKQDILRLYSTISIHVGAAQMIDVASSGTDFSMTEKQLFNMHHYKTSEYTFAMPMIAGAILSGVSSDVIDQLRSVAHALGLLFQLKDDQLGIFGDEKQLGKPIGSDIREGKRTLYRMYLEQKATDSEVEKLNSIFGNSSATTEDISFVTHLLVHYEVDQKVASSIKEHTEHCKELIDKQSFSKPVASWLQQLVIDLSEREK